MIILIGISSRIWDPIDLAKQAAVFCKRPWFCFVDIRSARLFIPSAFTAGQKDVARIDISKASLLQVFKRGSCCLGFF